MKRATGSHFLCYSLRKSMIFPAAEIRVQSNPPPVVLWERVLHVSGGRPSDCLAVMPGDHSKRHIDARRDPCRGEKIALLDDVLIVDHLDSGEQLSHLLQDTPMRRRSLAVQQTGLA